MKVSTSHVLRPIDWEKLFHVFCDASNVQYVVFCPHVCQSTRKKGKDEPLAYASKQLTP